MVGKWIWCCCWTAFILGCAGPAVAIIPDGADHDEPAPFEPSQRPVAELAAVNAAVFQRTAANPKAYLGRDYYALRAKVYDRFFADAYARIGWRSPKWDAAATAFLKGYARQLADAMCAPSYADLETDGRELDAMRCDDPAVLTCYGRVLGHNGKWKEARSALERAVWQVEQSEYSDACRLMALADTYDAIRSTRPYRGAAGHGRGLPDYARGLPALPGQRLRLRAALAATTDGVGETPR